MFFILAGSTLSIYQGIEASCVIDFYFLFILDGEESIAKSIKEKPVILLLLIYWFLINKIKKNIGFVETLFKRNCDNRE